MAAVMDCRLCLEKKRHLVEINNEIRETFFLITQMRLHRLEFFSNSICLICYKKMLAALGYRDMLVKIEEKLLNTFATNPNKSTPGPRTTKNSMRAMTNGSTTSTPTPGPSSHHIPITKMNHHPQLQQLKPHQIKRDFRRDDNINGAASEDDMSLLEEIVSFNEPDASNFLNEHEHDPQFSLLSDSEIQNDDDEIQFKDEPFDRPIVEIDESSNSHLGGFGGSAAVYKPFKCDIAGCSSSSTTLKALKKHRRRVHGIRVRSLDPDVSVSRQPVKRPPIKKLKLEDHPIIHSIMSTPVDDATPYQCKYCNLILRNRRVLCRHIETVHKQAKFYCTIDGCKHASTRKDNYRLHLKNYHRNLPEDELNQALQMTKNMQPIYVNKDFEMFEDEDEQINQMALKTDQAANVQPMGDSMVDSMVDENDTSGWFVKLPE